MILIAAFGVLMAGLSLVMVLTPIRWSRGLVSFSNWRYFHPFEIMSRLAFGLVFVGGASRTLFPQTIGVIGWVMVAVGIGLVVMRPAMHRQFAVWAAHWLLAVFRPAGLLGIVAGLWIIYAAVGGPAV